MKHSIIKLTRDGQFYLLENHSNLTYIEIDEMMRQVTDYTNDGFQYLGFKTYGSEVEFYNAWNSLVDNIDAKNIATA